MSERIPDNQACSSQGQGSTRLHSAVVERSLLNTRVTGSKRAIFGDLLDDWGVAVNKSAASAASGQGFACRLEGFACRLVCMHGFGPPGAKSLHIAHKFWGSRLVCMHGFGPPEAKSMHIFDFLGLVNLY